MPKARIGKTTPNVRQRGTLMSIRVSPGSQSVATTVPGGMFGGKGYPVGILMAITADRAHQLSSTTTTSGGHGVGPNVRIATI